MSFPQSKAFVLRFSVEAGPETGVFRGRVEHVSSGAQAVFESTADLWAFVRAVLLREDDDGPAALPPSRRPDS